MMEMRNRAGKKFSEKNGFTLLEVIAVLVIIAIIAAVIISRGMSTADVNLQMEIDTLKGHLRYAQYLALNENDTDTVNPPGTRVKWGIDVGESSYKLVKYNETNSEMTHSFSLPNESSDTHIFSPIEATPVIILFDEWGTPDNTSIDFGGQTIAITANTGFTK